MGGGGLAGSPTPIRPTPGTIVSILSFLSDSSFGLQSREISQGGIPMYDVIPITEIMIFLSSELPSWDLVSFFSSHERERVSLHYPLYQNVKNL